MNRVVALAVLLGAGLVLPTLAQTPDDQYVRIYGLIQQADSLNNAGQPAEALPRYLEAQAALQRLQRINPDYSPKVVNFRLNYVAAKIEALTPKVAPPAPVTTPARPAAPSAPSPPSPGAPTPPTELERQVTALQEMVRGLQSDRTILEAKLKEALATQPAAVDPRELARAEERIQSLMKENDLLKASLTEEQGKTARGADPKLLEQTNQALTEANRKLAEQTDRANALAEEKQTLQAQIASLKSSSENNADLAAARKALEEANRKLADQTESARKLSSEKDALQSRVAALTSSAEAAEALRAENQLLQKQVVEFKASPQGKGDTARQLAQVEAQLAALQSDAEILRLEKIALQNRIRQMSAAPVTTTVLPPPGPEMDSPRIKQLEAERDELRKKLEAANKELYGRKGREIAARIDELSGEITILRARLEVFEAKAVPYSTEELALLKSSQPRPATTVADPRAGRASVTALPAGTANLAAEAQRHFAAGQLDKAEANYLDMLRQDDRNVYTRANLAAIQLELNRLDEAEKNITQALAIAPDDAYSLSLLGYLRYRQERYDEALDVLSRAAKLNPQSAEIQNYLGVTLSHKGQRGPAETALRKAIQLDPGYGAAHNNLAVIYAAQNPPLLELARWHYKKALAAGHPANPELEKLFDRKVTGDVK